jgi:Na+-translocating ferredoxin:NAD+ oxidoreductase RnfG subunit
MSSHRMRRASFVVTLLLAALVPAWAEGQARTSPTQAQLQAVVPWASRFSEKRGRPPVFEAYAADGEAGREQLVAYAFLTSDLPPEMTGYSGPIEALVGVDLDGVLTGVRVVQYHESLQESRGDFLARRGFQEQYAGKGIGDAFRVRSDIDGISGATITVRALSLSVRNAARRVVAAHVSKSASGPGATKRYIATIEPSELGRMSWGEMLEAGLGGQVSAGDVTISLTYLRDDAIGELLLGPGAFQTAVAKVGERVHEYHLMLLGIDGVRALGPLPRVFFAQGADTIRPTREDFIDAGGITLGGLEGAFRRPVLLLVDHALDVSAPFRIGLAQCCGNPSVTADYVLQEPIPTVAADLAPSAGEAPTRAAPADAEPAVASAEAPTSAGASPRRAVDPPKPTPTSAEADGTAGLPPWVQVSGLLLLTGLAIAGVAALASSARTRGERRRSTASD